jgi:hypothetical protein
MRLTDATEYDLEARIVELLVRDVQGVQRRRQGRR